MSSLKNYREVGLFDVLIAPISPLTTFDAEQFKTEAQQLLDGTTVNLVVDLAGLDFLYSDAYNAFMQIQSQVAAKGGVFGILTNNTIIIKGLQQAGLDRLVHVFEREADVMGFSLASNKKIESRPPDIERIERPTAVMSQNAGHAEQAKGKAHRLTQSFNSVDQQEADTVQGMGDPFTGSHPIVDSKSNSLWTILGAMAALAAILGLIYFIR
jgi:anti-anti-sigma factor